jgi:hypothetical protein
MENSRNLGKDLTYEQFSSVMTELEAFYNKTLTSFQKGIYWDKLTSAEEMTEESLFNAIAVCITRHPCAGNFFPSVDMLIEYALGTNEERIRRRQEKLLSLKGESKNLGFSSYFDTSNAAAFKKRLNELMEKITGNRNITTLYAVDGSRIPLRETVEERKARNDSILESWQNEGLL